ncbi:MAG: ligand-binding sensor domain-containing protein [Eubacteriales bacterium]
MNNMIFKFITSIALLSILFQIPLNVVNASTASMQDGNVANSVVFNKLSTSEMISYNAVYSISKDNLGYMWFGSTVGLYKYDSIDPYRIAGISNDSIRCSYQDYNILWIGTKYGLNSLNLYTGEITSYLYNPDNPTSISNNSIRSIYEDSQGFLWIGTYGGLNIFNKETEEFTSYVHDSNDGASISNNVIRAIYEDSFGQVWIGTDNGLNVFNSETEEFTSYVHDANNGDSISNNVIRAIYEDSFGQVWIGTDNGLNVFNSETEGFTSYVYDSSNTNSINNNFISCIYEDSFGQLWIGTDNGLNVLNRETEEFTSYVHDPTNPNSIGNNNIKCIYEDDIGILWIGTEAGVYYSYFNNPYYTYDYQLADENIRAVQIYEDTIIFGTLSKIVCYNYKNDSVDYQISFAELGDVEKAYTNCICIDELGSIWVGTDYFGLLRMDMDTMEFSNYLYDSDNPSDSVRILSLYYVANQRLLWIGTNHGLYLFNYEDEQLTKYNPYALDSINIDDIAVNVIFGDSSGNVWIGTDIGLSKYNTGKNALTTCLNDDNANYFANLQVTSMFEDNRGVLWIGTSKGLISYNLQTCEVNDYSIENILASEYIWGITDDGEGNIWMISDSSLCKLSIDSGLIYEYKQGLIYRTSIYRNHQGLIFVGTNNSLFSFNPAEIDMNVYSPVLLITGFSLLNGEQLASDKPIEEISEIVLPYSNNSFEIDFVALDYYSHNNEYTYILEGYDKYWQYCNANESSTRYTNLPSGEYTFVVNSLKNNWEPNGEGASLKIIIETPFWEQWWFICSMISIGIFSVFVLIKIRTRSIQLHAEKLDYEIEQRTQQLASKSEQLEEELNRRSEFTRALAHDLKTPCTPLLITSELIVQSDLPEPISSWAKNVYTGAKELYQRINDLLDLSKGEINALKLKSGLVDLSEIVARAVSYDTPLSESCGISIDNKVNDIIQVYGDEQRIHQILHNILDNAIKYTPRGGIITVKAFTQNEFAVISVTDTGSGVSQKDAENLFLPYTRLHDRKDMISGLGLGLCLSKMLVELHGGQIWVEKEKQKGCTFSFSIPLYKETKND